VPEFTRPATWEDVKRLAVYLDKADVEYALIGGYGLAAHGLTRFTEDVDLLVDPSPANSRRWILALSRLPDGAAHELAADPDVFGAQKRYAIRVNDELDLTRTSPSRYVPYICLCKRDLVRVELGAL